MPSSRFDEFVQAQAEGLLRTAYVVTWDLDEAEDLVQECLLKLAKRWPHVQSMEMPDAYARKVLVNLALDGGTRRFRRRSELLTSGCAGNAHMEVVDLNANAAAELLGAREELLVGLGRLPKQQRTVLVLRYFLDLSEAQTAETLGCSTGAVKSNASRGLARLRQLIPSPSKDTEVCES